MDCFAFARHIHLGTFRWRTFGKGRKYWLADWMNHLSITYVGDRRAKSTNQIHEAYENTTTSPPLLLQAKHSSLAQQASNMSVKDICSLCNENLRIKGTISGSRSIFQKKDPREKSISEQLTELGLPLAENTG